jgi:hypothetical protein
MSTSKEGRNEVKKTPHVNTKNSAPAQPGRAITAATLQEKYWQSVDLLSADDDTAKACALALARWILFPTDDLAGSLILNLSRLHEIRKAERQAIQNKRIPKGRKLGKLKNLDELKAIVKAKAEAEQAKAVEPTPPEKRTLDDLKAIDRESSYPGEDWDLLYKPLGSEKGGREL